MALKQWVKLPAAWIEGGGLCAFKWEEQGAAATAALMVLMPIAHNVDPDSGIARQQTYDKLGLATGLSRTSISQGLRLLEDGGIIRCNVEGRSSYQLEDFNPAEGWAKLPAKGLYNGSQITAFQQFHLRQKSELDALKAYFTFVARRDRHMNLAHLSYDKIRTYAGIPRHRIKTAISVLAALGLAHVERLPSTISDYGSSAYRLTHLESYNHMGTKARGMPVVDA